MQEGCRPQAENVQPPKPAARRSPRIRAPRDCRRLATADAKRRSPPIDVMSSLNSGALVWFERWLLPICCTAWSAAQGSCKVMCTRLRWLATRRSACREMPALAASEMMATSFLPSWKFLRSSMFNVSSSLSLSCKRRTYSHLPRLFTNRILRAAGACQGQIRLSCL